MPAGYNDPASAKTAKFVCNADVPSFEVTTFMINLAGVGVRGERERQHHSDPEKEHGPRVKGGAP